MPQNSDDTVRVTDPQGRSGTIPRENLQKALALGYKTAPVPSPWQSISKGFKEYVTEPAKQMGTEAWERGQRTSPGGGIGAAAFELPGTIIDAVLGMQSEQMGRSAAATKGFEAKPGLDTGMKAISEAAYSIPGAGPLMRDFVTTEDPFEMIGKAAGIVTGEYAPKVVGSIGRGVHGTAENLFLPGEHEVSSARAAKEAKIDQVKQENLQNLAVARSEHYKDLARLDSEYQKRVEEVGQKTAEDEAVHKAKVAQSKEEFARKEQEFKTKTEEFSQREKGARVKKDTFQTPRSGPVYKRLSSMADQMGQFANKLDKTVRATYNTRWGAWRLAMGDATGNLEIVQKAVGDAENSILKGSPDNIAIFRNILSEGEDPLLSQASVFKGNRRAVDLKEVLGSMKSEGERTRFLRSLKDEGIPLEGEQPGAKEGATLPIDQMRGYSTELGYKMKSGQFQGDVYRAMKSVKEVIDKEVERVSGEHGQLDFYRKLRDDWTEYMDDFYDHDGALYKMKSAVNSDRRLSVILGGDGSRVMTSLGHYKGLSREPMPYIEMAVDMRKLTKYTRDLPPAGEAPRPVPPYEAPAAPKPQPMPERPSPPESVAIKPQEMPSPFNRQEFQRERFRKVVDRFRGFGWDDKAAIMGGLIEMYHGKPPWALPYVAIKRTVGKILGSERFERWLIDNRQGEIARTTAILNNPRADNGQKALARAELEMLYAQSGNDGGNRK
jgi:hypothetical protein